MLVLIDESGDPGFKVARGASPVFVVAMTIFNDFEEAERASTAIANARDTLRVKPEFKFNKCHHTVKDGFFGAVAPFNFTVRSLVVIKERIYSENLRGDTDVFYNYFVQALMKYDNTVLQGARVKIDGSGNREFKKKLAAYLRNQLGPDKIRNLKFVDSRRDNLIQLADMVAGAIARSYKPDKRGYSDRWFRILRESGKIGDIWEFK